MLSRKMRGAYTPTTPDQRVLKSRKAEKRRLASLEHKMDQLLGGVGTMQDLNEDLLAKNKAL